MTRDPRRARNLDRRRDPYAELRARGAAERASADREAGQGPPSGDDWVAPGDDEASLRVVGPPEAVGALAARVVADADWSERLEGATLAGSWGEVVGDELAARCRPVRLDGGVLVVEAVDQIWATQLRYLTAQVRDHANRVLAGARVREVRVTVGGASGREG